MSETIRHFEVAWETGSRRLSKCIVGLFWGTNLTPRWKCVPQNGPTMHVTTISTRSPAQPQNGELLQLYFFLPPWWQEVHIFPTLTPVAQVAITVCIFPRKRAPVASFTALNNLPFHHRSPATEPCYKFPCASNRLHIAHGTGTRFLFRALLLSCPWGQRSIKNDLERTELPEGFAYPTSPPPPPLPASMVPISARRGRVISGRLANRFGSRFNTNTKLLRGVIGPISTPNDYRHTVFGWGSYPAQELQKQCPPTVPKGKALTCCNFSLGVNSLSFKYKKGIYYLKIAPSNRNKITWILSVVAFSSEIRKLNIQKFSGFENILYHYLFQQGVMTLL